MSTTKLSSWEMRDEALEGECCRNCGYPFDAHDPIILAVCPAGYEAAYCSMRCLRQEQRESEGGER